MYQDPIGFYRAKKPDPNNIWLRSQIPDEFEILEDGFKSEKNFVRTAFPTIFVNGEPYLAIRERRLFMFIAIDIANILSTGNEQLLASHKRSLMYRSCENPDYTPILILNGELI